MISKFDDFLLQQISSTTDHVEDSDPRWYERYRFTVWNPAGDVVVAHGLGVYPNVNLLDAFGVIEHRDERAVVLGSRALAHERMDTHVGTLSVSVVEGLTTTRIAMSDGPIGAYDFMLHADGSVFDRAPLPILRVDGLVAQRASMFAQAGTASGWVRLGGSAVVSGDDWRFIKSNSWGMRARRGAIATGSASAADAQGLFVAAELNGTTIYADGSQAQITVDGATLTLLAAAAFDRDGGTLTSLRCTLRDDAGRDRQLVARPLKSVPLDDIHGHHLDAFDGLYRSHEHYSAGGQMRDRVEHTSERPVRGDRVDYVCSVTLDDQIGMGVVEVSEPA